MYDGMISGTFSSLQENANIVQKWRMKDWTEGTHSEVTITFADAGDDSTEVTVD